ncbi:HDOD domain-containing protein [Colwellia sp. 1_MG-2023]|uniref:HDOD domain-containing protein n=1 Tax=Colwellia sp. 1_MG-2023 TaxID=3062649 RepID=UPI0026E32A2A|nr:HDOD domain-containing protein [Colwellia sp. 1_MG-2023]MDO6445549.1 HDOD domain-containing protein [Colwellia sp. 1_MG-2023]
MYFEDSKQLNEHDDEVVNTVSNLSSASPSNNEIKITNQFDQLSDKFSHYLFGQTINNISHDELSQFVESEIVKLLDHPKALVKSLPVLPLSLTTLIDELKNDDFNTELLISIINKEPMVAAKVIELANSAKYNHHNREITDLKSAFMTIGANGLSEGIIVHYLKRMKPTANVYFKHYGEKIWLHSLSTGNNCQSLLSISHSPTDKATAYLIGLILNLGAMVVFQLLIQAFSFVNPNCTPDSAAFKALLKKYAPRITYQIAKFWQLPEKVTHTLKLQLIIKDEVTLANITKKFPLAGYTFEANAISQLHVLFQENKITEDELKEISQTILYSSESKTLLAQILTQ